MGWERMCVCGGGGGGGGGLARPRACTQSESCQQHVGSAVGWVIGVQCEMMCMANTTSPYVVVRPCRLDRLMSWLFLKKRRKKGNIKFYRWLACSLGPGHRPH